MPRNGRLFAWTDARNCGRVLASFVGGIAENPTRRVPATQLCASNYEAKQWVEYEAAVIGIPVKWVAPPKG